MLWLLCFAQDLFWFVFMFFSRRIGTSQLQTLEVAATSSRSIDHTRGRINCWESTAAAFLFQTHEFYKSHLGDVGRIPSLFNSTNRQENKNDLHKEVLT